jgi:hypothetical protein
MKELSRNTAVLALTALLVFAAAGEPQTPPREAAGSPEAAAAAASTASSAKDRSDISVTVYNSNRALVRDVRRVELPRGKVSLNFLDIAAQIQPETVQIASSHGPDNFQVLEQNYEYDLLNPDQLLKKYLGREVTLSRTFLENNSTVEKTVQAILLADNDQPVWKIGDRIVTGIRADRYVFPDVPNNLYSKPTLIWLLNSHIAGRQTLAVSYLTREMGWTADYVLTLGPDEKTGDLNGWVTIQNHSGTEYANALLQLVAGEVHTVQPAPGPRGVSRRMMNAVESAPVPFAQEQLSEYHLYTLDRRTDLRDQESKQISLLASQGISIEKVYRVTGQSYYYQTSMQPDFVAHDPVQVQIECKNSKTNGLGMPLPAGTVRVYKQDSAGRAQFIGEDSIRHTPVDEALKLHIGNAFDVAEDRKQTDYEVLGRNGAEMAYEITLRNHKPVGITVQVEEPLRGEWKTLQSNFDYTKTSAFSARFKVPVPAGGEAVLKYRVRSRW